jgi:hypothetical protein
MTIRLLLICVSIWFLVIGYICVQAAKPTAVAPIMLRDPNAMLLERIYKEEQRQTALLMRIELNTRRTP